MDNQIQLRMKARSLESKAAQSLEEAEDAMKQLFDLADSLDRRAKELHEKAKEIRLKLSKESDKTLILALKDYYGFGVKFTTKELFSAITSQSPEGLTDVKQVKLREALIEFNPPSVKGLRQLGRTLTSLRDLHAPGCKFVRWETKSKKPTKMWIESTEGV